jgi:hypothetical protein
VTSALLKEFFPKKIQTEQPKFKQNNQNLNRTTKTQTEQTKFKQNNQNADRTTKI